MRKELEEGTVLVNFEESESHSEEVTASIELKITYWETHVTKSTKEVNLQSITIRTDNEGGGNYFRMETGYPPSEGEDDNVSTFAFEDFEKVERIIRDFKKRYELVKKQFKQKKI